MIATAQLLSLRLEKCLHVCLFFSVIQAVFLFPPPPCIWPILIPCPLFCVTKAFVSTSGSDEKWGIYVTG